MSQQDLIARFDYIEALDSRTIGAMSEENYQAVAYASHVMHPFGLHKYWCFQLACEAGIIWG